MLQKNIEKSSHRALVDGKVAPLFLFPFLHEAVPRTLETGIDDTRGAHMTLGLLPFLLLTDYAAGFPA